MGGADSGPPRGIEGRVLSHRLRPHGPLCLQDRQDQLEDWQGNRWSEIANPPHLKAHEMAEVVFEPQQPFVCEGFKACEGLGRVAIMEGSSVVMLGKAIAVEFKADDKK